MGRTKAALAARAWGLLHLTLLWARKGEAFRRRLLSGGIRGNFLKGPRGSGAIGGVHGGYPIRDGEKELSFSDTPVFRLGSMRCAGRRAESIRVVLGSISCINTPRPADLGFKDDEECVRSRSEAFIRRSKGETDSDNEVEEEFDSVGWSIAAQEGDDEDFACLEWVEGSPEAAEEEKGVDARAEEFIARFYQQIKLQRQVSLLQYHEMLHRGT